MPFQLPGSSALRFVLLALGLAMLAACTPPTIRRAPPVEDRSARSSGASAPAPVSTTASAADATKLLPGAENAGKPGYYTVKPGDTMIRIGLETGQNWRDVARWNGMDNANVIEVGQVLRTLPPGVDPGAVASKGVATAKVEPRPLESRPGVAASAPATQATPAASAPALPASAAPGGAVPLAASAPAAAVATPAPKGDDEPAWAWPATGPVLAHYDDARNKGLAIGGKTGDPVLAAADGRVVYAGSGLRGYGNLVIVKHNANYLTAYAHNQTLLVKEEQTVRRGQKIAEMGATDAERVQLHFEIRKLGKPLDPAKLLPPR
ncbi:peptidoglycan DD-metalloendopeptidase family protein [Methylibium sp.]|uniref:peptidoglycan DD-metalloendopeptidase family protein n=1 Tax=Methylibium sp. TaxID=2067992 RepID=UPI00286B1390|nr:peptidoglycan DD-metalloendopeptidase family protein [Methylibium sp.]